MAQVTFNLPGENRSEAIKYFAIRQSIAAIKAWMAPLSGRGASDSVWHRRNSFDPGW